MPIANLLPEDYKAVLDRRRAYRVCIMIFPIVCGGVILALLASRGAVRNTVQAYGDVMQAYGRVHDVARRLESAESRALAATRQSESNAACLDRLPPSVVLAAVVNCLPEQTSITRFEYVVTAPESPSRHTLNTKKESLGGGPLPGPSQAAEAAPRPKLRLAGLAANDMGVGKFMSNLSRCPLLSGVTLQYSQARSEKESVREYQILLEVDPGAKLEAVTVRSEEPRIPEGASERGTSRGSPT